MHVQNGGVGDGGWLWGCNGDFENLCTSECDMGIVVANRWGNLGWKCLVQ